MRKLLILCLFFSASTFGQKKQTTYFLKEDGRQVETKEKADFIRMVEEPDSGSVFYHVNEYYPNNTKKRTGDVSKIDPHLVFEGEVTSYFRNGNKSEVVNYKNGEPNGMSSFYYQNGHLKEVVEITKGQGVHVSSGNLTREVRKLVSFYDSTGTETVKNGNGTVKRYNEKKEIIEEGRYVDGQKDGVWTGRVARSTYEESYHLGSFVSGIAKDENGKTSTYKEPEQMPDYPGGMKEFYTYVGKNFTYPSEARRKGISGRIILSFVVEKNGELSNIKVLRDIGGGTGDEAVRMLKRSPRWNPGLQHGVPVRVQYNLPIMLNLG